MTDEVSGNRLNAWYDLFSRGARDWLRHNEKVRDAVRAHLPQVVAGADVLSRGHSTVRVPVRMLEHYRFRLRAPDQVEGVGQGAAKPGDRIETGADPAQGSGRGTGGDEDGGIQYTLEFQVDDIVDWLWEEMQLPNLENRAGQARDDDWTREGWDRRGARSRLDRRRSLKESIKRQAVNQDSPTFTDEDLRYRQLAKREQPATQAVVFLVLDVSASMGEEHRKLAKSFFFWAVQGLRRQYRQLEVVFIAHTTEAWEFAEEEFFRVTGSGGTFMSTALDAGAQRRRRAVQPVAIQPLSLLCLRRGEFAQRQRRHGRRPQGAARRSAVLRLSRGGLRRRRRSVERHRQALSSARRRRPADRRVPGGEGRRHLGRRAALLRPAAGRVRGPR